MRGTANPRGRKGEFARAGFCQCDELLKIGNRENLRVDDQRVGQLRHDADRNELRRIKVEFGIEVLANDERSRRGGEERVAVGICSCYKCCAKI